VKSDDGLQFKGLKVEFIQFEKYPESRARLGRKKLMERRKLGWLQTVTSKYILVIVNDLLVLWLILKIEDKLSRTNINTLSTNNSIIVSLFMKPFHSGLLFFGS